MAITPIRLALAAAFLFSVGLAALQLGNQGNALSRLEGYLLDFRFVIRGTLRAPSDITILAIDNTSLNHAGVFPLPRDVLGEAVSVALERGAEAVVLDLLLAGQTQGDFQLAAALDQGQTALAVSITQDGAPASEEMQLWLASSSYVVVWNTFPPGPNGVLGPNTEFSGRSQLGHVNIRLDDDGALRRIPVAIRLDTGGPILPSLSVVAARLKARLEPEALALTAGEALFLDDRLIPVAQNNMVILNYFGPRGTIQTVSIEQVRETDLKGKLVFIGATADAYRDNFNTPFDAALPGVEVLATLTANILQQTALRRDQTTWVLSSLLLVIAGTSAAFVGSLGRLFSVVSGSAVIWIGSLIVTQVAFALQIWLDVATLLAALTIGTLLGFGARWETHRKRGMNLARYHSPQLVEALASNAQPKFHGRMQNAAILFVDLAGFTRRSAEIGPKKTAVLLNRFHTLTNDVARHWSGTVLYTAGDGAMVVFGLPNTAPDDGSRAFDCAMELLVKISNDQITGVKSRQNSVRIGAHFGEVYATVLGEGGRSTPTVTGDVVNVASRLQDLAKNQSALFAASAEFYEEAKISVWPGWQNLGAQTLAGRREKLRVWIMTSLPPNP